MNPVAIALVGCGRMGRAHLAAASAVRDVRIMAVCDPRFCAQEQIPYPVLSFEEALESRAIEAVLIAAPTPTHDRLTCAALDHGKHVLCEKPLTFEPRRDEVLAARAADRGCILQVGFWRRFAEPYLRLRAAVSEVGHVIGVRTAQWDARAPDPTFCDPRVSGGIEIDCGVHEFDLVRWLLDVEIEWVAACGPRPSRELEAVGDMDTVFGLARLDGGRAMTIDLTRTAGYRDSIRTEVIGEHGSIVVEFADTGTLIVRSRERREVIDCMATDVICDALDRQLRAFAGAVRTGRRHPDAAGPLDSARALIAARALRDARHLGVWRALDG